MVTNDRTKAASLVLTPDGRRRLAGARGTVYVIDQRITDSVPARRLGDLLADLDRMAEAVDEAGPVPVFDQDER